MKALQDTPTAELLAEWGKLNKLNEHIYRTTHDEDAGNVDSMSAIAAELDRRCSEAGIQLHVDGMVSFSKFGDKTDDMVCPRIYAADLRDLITWLLLKGGNG